MRQNIIITGFMGTGKTTVGKILAEDLTCPFLDVDQQVVDIAGKEISAIFAQEGEGYFRQLETRALTSALLGESKVISTGGGILLRKENRELIQNGGLVICLTASPQEIVRRLAQGQGRPLLEGGNALHKVRELLKERSPLYAEIGYQFVTDGKRPREIVQEILLLLQEKGLT